MKARRILAMVLLVAMMLSMVVLPVGADELPCLHEHYVVQETITAATCTTTGQVRAWCNDCSQEVYIETPVTDHNWDAGAETSTPTCQAEGTLTKSCQNPGCSATKTEPIAVVDHEYDFDHIVQTVKHADCWWEAELACKYGCGATVWRDYVNDGVFVKEHTFNVPAPTCTEAKTCTVCGRTYENALNHSLVDVDEQAPTCTEVGWHAYQRCDRPGCGWSSYAENEISALDHLYVDVPAQDPSCTEVGWNAYQYCDRVGCGWTTYAENELQALDHDYIDHDAQAATCEEIGWYAYQTCSRCDYTTYVEISATDHSWVDTTTVAAKCGVDGYTIQTCQNPGCTYAGDGDGQGTRRVIDEGSALEHLWTTDDSAAPSCVDETDGWENQHCTRDGCTATRTIITKWTHTVVADPGVAATCKETGLTPGQHCSVCMATLLGQEVIEMIDHTWNQDAATCLVDKHCTFCGHVEEEALDHDYIDWDAQAPSCEEIGWDAYQTCSRCDYTTYVELNALDHDEQTEVVDPTCQSQGYTKHFCSRCDWTGDNTDYVDALPHDWMVGEENYVWQPVRTCEAVGIAYKQCAVCGTLGDYTTFAPLGHKYELSETVAATCEDDAYNRFTCTRPGCDSYYDVMPAGGEALNHIPGAEATCTEPQICTREGCGQILVPALDHLYMNVPAQDATCTEVGWNAYQYCDRVGCGWTTYAENEIPALDHDIAYVDAQAPTCTEIGWDAFEYCKRDGCDYSTYFELSALDHDYVDHDAQPATCTDIGWDAYQTCGREGCDYTTYVEIPALNHDHRIFDTVVPDCVNGGYNVYKCTRCPDQYNADFVDALDHDFNGNVIDTVDSTILVPGYKIVQCTRCTETEVQVLPTLQGLILAVDVDNAVVPGAQIVDSGIVAVKIQAATTQPTDVWGFNFQLVYNNALFQYMGSNMDVYGSEFAGSMTATVREDIGTIYGVATTPTDADGNKVARTLDGEYDYVTLFFRVTANNIGRRNVAFDFTVAYVSDVNSQPVAHMELNTTCDINRLGNLNGDFDTNIFDLSAMLDIILNDGEYNACADIDKDGAITAYDFACLKDYLGGTMSYEEYVAIGC